LTGVSSVFHSPWPNTVSLPAPLSFLALAVARIRSAFELAARLRTAQAGPNASLAVGTLLLAGNKRGVPGSMPGRTKECSKSRIGKSSFGHKRISKDAVRTIIGYCEVIYPIAKIIRETPGSLIDVFTKYIILEK
jgi:hypothetical protein